MSGDRNAFQLEILEARILLSAEVSLDGVAAAPLSESPIVLKLEATQKNSDDLNKTPSVYSPEAQIPDLFEVLPQHPSLIGSQSAQSSAIQHQSLEADLAPSNSTEPQSNLTPSTLAPIVAEAKLRWTSALTAAGVSPSPDTTSQLAILDNLQFDIADLSGLQLGQQTNGEDILIDSNAAGWGWFIDSTPSDDSEFDSTATGVGSDNTAPMRIDLLTVVMHELGHALGYGHSNSGLMANTLNIGARRSISPDQLSNPDKIVDTLNAANPPPQGLCETNALDATEIPVWPVHLEQFGIITWMGSPYTNVTGESWWTWHIQNPDADTDANPGWDSTKINGSLCISASPTITEVEIDANTTIPRFEWPNRYTIEIVSVTGANAKGQLDHFDNTQTYVWNILQTRDGIVGFDPQAFNLNLIDFKNNLGQGKISIELTPDGKGINLRFTGGPKTTSYTQDTTWTGGAGALRWEINDAQGGVGTDPGWDLVNLSGDLTIDASASSYRIEVYSLSRDNVITSSARNVIGQLENFDKSHSYEWILAAVSGNITVSGAGSVSQAFEIDLFHFMNDFGSGAFSVQQASEGSKKILKLCFTPNVESRAVADSTNHTITIRGPSDDALRSFDANYANGNSFAVGDINANGVDEIIVCRPNQIELFNQLGMSLGTFPTSFSPNDVVGIGDVNGNGSDEITYISEGVVLFLSINVVSQRGVVNALIDTAKLSNIRAFISGNGAVSIRDALAASGYTGDVIAVDLSNIVGDVPLSINRATHPTDTAIYIGQIIQDQVLQNGYLSIIRPPGSGGSPAQEYYYHYTKWARDAPNASSVITLAHVRGDASYLLMG